MKYRAAAVVGLALLAACAPGTSGGVPPVSSAFPLAQSAGVHNRATATVVITLPPIHQAGAPVDWSIDSLSSATATARVKIGTKKYPPVTLNASNGRCVAGNNGLSCTLVAATKPGQNKTIAVQTFANGFGKPLAIGRATTNLYRGRNVVSLQLAGIAHTIRLAPATVTLHHGQYLLDQISLQAYDSAHQLIPSVATVAPNGYSFTVIVAYSGFVAASDVSGYPYFFYTPNQVATFPYDGVASGTETITATPNAPSGHTVGIAAASTTLTVVPGSTDFAPIAFGINVPTRSNHAVETIGQFALASSSSSGPVRQFINAYHTTGSSDRPTPAPVFGEDSSGNFWIGNVHLSNSLAILGTVTLPANVRYPIAVDRQGHLYAAGKNGSDTCAVYEFPNKYGSLKPTREIDGPCASRVATDTSGNVYVADTFYQPEGSGSVEAFGVQEFAANGGSGNVAPIRTMVVAKGLTPYGAGFTGLDVDDAGNVYVAAQTQGFDKPNPSNVVYEFAPAATKGTPQLASLQVGGFAVDDAGDIFALVGVAGEPGSALEEFPPGATTPTRTFAGPTWYGSPILVPH